MPLIIHELPKKEDKEIIMGKQPKADYYPPGATEPQVRPDNVPAEEEATVVESVAEPVEEQPKAEPKKAAPKSVAKKK